VAPTGRRQRRPTWLLADAGSPKMRCWNRLHHSPDAGNATRNAMNTAAVLSQPIRSAPLPSIKAHWLPVYPRIL